MADHTTTRLAQDAFGEGAGRNEHHALLFERVIGRVYRYFYKLVRDRAEAEDLAQQTLLELERSLREGRYDPGRSFNRWLWIKAHTQFAQWCRRRERRRVEPLTEALDPPAPGDPILRREEQLDARAVLDAVAERLGDEAYECFVLLYEGGLSQLEIADVLGRNRKTVARRLAAAHALIDRLLAGRPAPR